MDGRTATDLRARARAAAAAAPRHYPGAIGELLARELGSWAGYGYALGGHRLVAGVVAHLETLAVQRRAR